MSNAWGMPGGGEGGGEVAAGIDLHIHVHVSLEKLIPSTFICFTMLV